MSDEPLNLTDADLEAIQDNLQKGLEVSVLIVKALDAAGINCSSRSVSLGLLMVARIVSEGEMPDRNAFADTARVAAGYLELRERNLTGRGQKS